MTAVVCKSCRNSYHVCIEMIVHKAYVLDASKFTNLKLKVRSFSTKVALLRSASGQRHQHHSHHCDTRIDILTDTVVL